MGLGAKLADAATAGLTGAVTGGIGSIISGGLGLLGGLFKKNNNGLKNQQKLMQQAWEYEKEGMGMQYEYGQAAANAAQQRNIEMWNQTNYGAQRQHMEDAGLTSAVTGGIGSIISGGLGLLGGLFKKNNNGLKNQQKLMQQACEYRDWETDRKSVV